MKQPTSEEDKKNSRETLNSLCSVSALLLSVACCMALIHVELRIQEHHRLISHSVTFCDQMETQILRKVQQNYERWQVMKVDDIKGHLQGTNGKENFYKMFWFLMLTSACFRSWRLWNLSLFNIMYKSNRSFNNPPPAPGHTPGIWHLCRPGQEGIWLSESSRGWGIWSPCVRGGEFELHPRFHVKSLAWRAAWGTWC